MRSQNSHSGRANHLGESTAQPPDKSGADDRVAHAADGAKQRARIQYDVVRLPQTHRSIT
jgi:hypothetical protein